LVSGGTGTPVYQNTLTLAGTTAASSTITGAFQVVGGAGIGGALYVGGTVTAPTFAGSLTGIATTATNLAGGATGSLPIQSAIGTTAFIPLGTSGFILTAGATTATWTATSGLTVGTATSATNIAGGTAGALPYQFSSGVTRFIGTGTTGSLLQMGATTASFVSSSTVQVGFAANVLTGAAGSIVYQSGANATTSLPIGTAGQILTVNGGATAPQWIPVGSLSITTATNIAGGTAGALNYQVSPGITGFIGTGTTGSLLQMGATTATFVTTGSIYVGNAVISTNIRGGVAGQIPYQTAANTTGFVTTASNGQVLVSGGFGAPVYQNTLTLSGTTAATSTITGALQVVGGVGIGGSLYVGGSINVPTITGTISTATNIAGGTAGQLHYQSAPGATAFVTVGTAGQILVSGGTGAPVYQNTLTLAGTTAATSVATGAFQVAGGAGIGGALYVGSTVTAPTFAGALTGTATTATNLAAGATGSIPIQSAIGTTAFIPLGTSGYVLTAGATTATWQPLSGVTAGSATTATNIAGGIVGQIPYQSAAGATQFIGTGTNGSILQMGANTATFVTTGSIYVSRAALADTATTATSAATAYALANTGTALVGFANTATNIAGGLPGQLVYQVAPGSTGFVTTATSGFVLTSRGTGSPVYQNTLTLSGSTLSTSTVTGALTVVGGVGIGGDVNIGGALNAISKSFLIDHPSKPGWKLVHGSLEGPENGVYVRGKITGSNKIHLPDFWINLVDFDTITVNLTPIGKYQQLFVETVEGLEITIANPQDSDMNFFYTVWAERIDIDKLRVEVN
jgi:hypothetical protein